MTDDDGVLDGNTSTYSIKMDSDGTLYHQSFKSNSKQLETGKLYNIRCEVDRENKCLSIYIDDSIWVHAVHYGQTNREYNCFRFMYPLASDVACTVSVDNFVITNTSPKKPLIKKYWQPMPRLSDPAPMLMKPRSLRMEKLLRSNI